MIKIKAVNDVIILIKDKEEKTSPLILPDINLRILMRFLYLILG